MALIFSNLVFLIPLIPIIAAFIALFLGNKLDRPHHGNLVALIALGSSFLLTLLTSGEVLLKLFLGEHIEAVTVEHTIEWFSVGGVSLDIGILIDPLAAVVSLMVALVSFLVVVYSRSYMADDGSPRYYAEINLFAAAMLGLCFSPNFIQFFLFWEIMGVCSYLLIGYYYDKDVVPEGLPHPASAAKKAFLTTKVGDVLLFVGIILLYLEAKTFNFIEIRHLLEEGSLLIDPMLFILIAVLIFGGAVGKSAQFPLHVWLPDAMAGPTTVSCLIHSATMVKAGIFLIARSYFLFEFASHAGNGEALLIIAIIGGITAIFAGTIALVKTDIKGILAYSTISQLGYMTLGLGVGGMAVAVFHIFNHGIFKALLFLSSGSVIHGAGTQDIRKMGGLKEKMPHTWKVMLIGSLSLAGIGNGFFSKDAIILHALHRGLHSGFSLLYDKLILLVWLSAVITAFLTAFYIFRLWFLVFPGTNRLPGHHIHESDRWMTFPLWTLAIVSLILTGFFTIGLFIPDLSFEHMLVHWLEPGVTALDFDWIIGISSVLIAIIGMALAYLVYYPRNNAVVSFPEDGSFKFEVKEKDSIVQLQQVLRVTVRRMKLTFIGKGLQRILEKGYYIDDLFLLLVRFIDTKFCAMMNWIERNIFDAAVRGVGKIGFALCGLSKWWDETVVDGMVILTAKISLAICTLAKATDERIIDHGIIRNSAHGVMKTGGYISKVQTGVVENYALYSLMGAIIILIIGLALAGVLPL
ncbi:MAG: NADH-quinone oxidoreductase subunit L [Candidatus Heimdallarchaeota archaeon]|nr:NADH-quinone oxidoreductase subunit L [Candidatus Heimdallarchaeota archaeon]